MRQRSRHADDIIDTLVAAIEAGAAPWEKPWKCDTRLPANLVTGATYNGRNLLMLATAQALTGYADHRWAGIKQINAAGGRVRRGERAQWICIMRTAGGSRRRDDDERTEPPDGENRNDGAERRSRSYTYTTFRPVWNAEQCENIAPPDDAGEADHEDAETRIASAETYLAGAPVTIRIGNRNTAEYRDRTDEVLLPRRSQFENPVDFYRTALHELAHATGHPSRLSRWDGPVKFASDEYVDEELVAELAAFLTGARAGLGHEPRPTASYIGTWLRGRADIRERVRNAVTNATAAAELLNEWRADGQRSEDMRTTAVETGEEARAAVIDGPAEILRPAC